MAGVGAAASGSPAAGLVAVVADRAPLLRIGLAATLRLAGLGRVEHAESLGDALQVGPVRADLIVVGAAGPVDLDLVTRRTPSVAARVIVLADRLERAALVGLLQAGVAGVLRRSVAPEDLLAAVASVLAGERFLDSPFLAVLAGLPGADEARGRHFAQGARSAVTGTEPSRGARPVARAAGRAPGGGGPVAEPSGAGLPASPAPGSGPEPLTAREREVLGLVAAGAPNAAVAAALYISTATVKTHLTSIYTKLAVSGRMAAVGRAVALGLLDSFSDHLDGLSDHPGQDRS